MSAPQAVRQAVPPALQVYAPQLRVPPALQVPPPQVDGAVCVPPEHDPAPQGVPSVLAANEQVPSPLHVPAWWHWSGAAQLYAVPAQVPFVHTSLSVHALPSLQVVPFDLFANEQVPSPLHVPAWQNGTGPAPRRCSPSRRTSPRCTRRSGCTRCRPSLQPVRIPTWPANEHVPSPLHVPACWHWSRRRAGAMPSPRNVPPVHTSRSGHTRCRRCRPCRRTWPRTSTSRRRLHVPACWWHWSGAAQVYARRPAARPPGAHVVLGTRGAVVADRAVGLGRERAHPVAGLHVPAPGGTGPGAAQVAAVPPHVPPVHTSFWVHAVPSLQTVAVLDLAANEHVRRRRCTSPPGWHLVRRRAGVRRPAARPPGARTSFWVHAVPSLQPVPSDLLGLVQDPLAGLHRPATWH